MRSSTYATTRGQSKVLIACAQYAIRDGDGETNLRRSLAWISSAAEAGVDLVVLPELSNSGCDFSSREMALRLAEPVPEGPTVRAWAEAARKLGLLVVGGLLEADGENVYNSAVIVGPDGLLGRYRKTHFWDREGLIYEAGRELPVFETPLGTLGLLVCYDAWFPEAIRTLAMRGAEVLCVPANAPDDWVPDGQRRGGLTMLGAHAIAGANANRMYVACANRVGDGYQGRSCVVAPSGGMLAFGDAYAEGLVLAEVDVERARREKYLTPHSHAFGDRNEEVYKILPVPSEVGGEEPTS